MVQVHPDIAHSLRFKIPRSFCHYDWPHAREDDLLHCSHDGRINGLWRLPSVSALPE